MPQKSNRWVSKPYTRWVASLPCSICREHDDTVVAHHLKHVWMPHGGGVSQKANDYLTMPLCYEHHRMLHAFEDGLVEFQPDYIFTTLKKAFHYGILGYKEPIKLLGEDKDG